MEQLYHIESRYQKWTRNGIEWTDWFVSYTDRPSTDTSYLKDRISIYKEQDKQSKQKLKHEYRISKVQQ